MKSLSGGKMNEIKLERKSLEKIVLDLVFEVATLKVRLNKLEKLCEDLSSFELKGER